MSLKFVVIPFVAAAGVAMGMAAAPVAVAQDPCDVPVSTSRCLGPQGIDGYIVPSPNAGMQNGPYGPWGASPPIGR